VMAKRSLDTHRVMTSTVPCILIPNEQILLFDKYDRMYDFIDSTRLLRRWIPKKVSSTKFDKKSVDQSE
jgi:hypothetical protein